jgi:hypothetical protein
MVNLKKLKIDLQVLRAVLAEAESLRILTYIDTETGDVLLERDMFIEELKNQKRFLEVPHTRIFSIDREAIERWVEDIQQIAVENYDSKFAQKVKDKLEQAVKQTACLESVCASINELQSEGLDDNYFSAWLDFTEREETNSIKTWLASKGITLVHQ